MGVHVTRYETKDGKTRKVKGDGSLKSAASKAASEKNSGAGNQPAGNAR